MATNLTDENISNLSDRRQLLLLLGCCLSCIFYQVGRYSYTSNVTLIMERFTLDHATASLPATLFFFSYGIGQIFVGIFCHKFNRRFLIIQALIITGLVNLVVFLGAGFIAIKYMWLLNGLAQANLWPVLLLILRENLSSKRMVVASIMMSIAATGGKLFSIGVCALFAIDTSFFMYSFLAAAVLLFICAVMFFCLSFNIKKPLLQEKNNNFSAKPKQKLGKKDFIIILLLGEFSLASYAISGGLQLWVPAILKENYLLSDSLSIFMSVLLPLFTLPVAFVSPYLYKKLKNYVLISLISFVFGAIWIILVLVFLDAHWLPVLILFTVEAITMGIITNTTTVQVPLTFNGKFDAGFLAGCLNGACYLGIAVSTYVLGGVADSTGWTSAFIILIAIALFSILLAVFYMLFSKRKKIYTYTER